MSTILSILTDALILVVVAYFVALTVFLIEKRRAKLTAGLITPQMLKLAREVIDNRDAGIAPLNVPAQALATLVIGAAK